ncbi:outer membrane lipoprotein-sorting protein LolA [Psychroflexus gondwanensis ACAM 44]|uniref:Outer membrane lipoprotein-sorting protein LolA n=1 Tax=Psychroflexus gondwanensis ACAM 44 TaxID=1189619 RepID=N1WQW4_9FLAO|nr:outer membrane lipoprotein carrier protein LolA [Psychroflexus gondwanensis]EMY81375.1 outer membrane lipoprotein-sorting protein LolA [Psychroflexus gondwanensis ACAM 44]
MKKIALSTFILFTLFLSHSIVAQDDPEAKKLVKEVLNKVESYDNLVIDFSYTLENQEQDLKQETRGDVSIKGDKYVLNLMGTTQIFDGKKIYTIVPEDEEVTISSYDEMDTDQITPSKMLTFYEEGYRFKMDIIEDVKGRKIQYVELIPMDSKNEMKQILLGIDRQTKHIFNLIQIQPEDTKIEFRVTKFKTNEPLSANHFQFQRSKYADYYINELD